LILQLCHGKKDGQAAKKNGKDKSSTKLLVRNVAFEATEKDLRQLFSPFGQVSVFFRLNLEEVPTWDQW
jgi:multiple RNA-binding domain-containing protein 1